MSTEQQPKHKPPQELHGAPSKHDETILAKKLRSFWESLKSGSSFWSYALFLGLLAGIGGYFLYNYFSGQSQEKSAKLWYEFQTARDLKDLEELAELDGAEGTLQARVAWLERARILLGPRGIDNLGTRNKADREGAIASISDARKIFRELTEQFDKGSDLQCQALWGAAQAEESLVGISDPKDRTKKLGNLDQVITDLRQIADVAPDTPMARAASEKADQIEKNKKQMLAFYTELNTQIKDLIDP